MLNNSTYPHGQISVMKKLKRLKMFYYQTKSIIGQDKNAVNLSKNLPNLLAPTMQWL